MVPQQPRGSIETYRWADGRTVTIRARVRAYGRRYRIDFGTNHEGWSEERARVELEKKILPQIERGTWEPPVTAPAAAPDEPGADETFHVFASRWWQEKAPTLAENTRADYRWRLDYLLAHFHKLPVDGIDRREVDRYRAAKVAEREPLEQVWKLYRAGKAERPRRKPLSNESINKTIVLLGQILESAVEYGLLDANPARGRKRRLPAQKSKRSFLEPDMVVDLLDAAGKWERELPPHQRYGRRAFLAGLTLGGFRIAELSEAERGALDLQGGRLRVPDSKTGAGVRDVELSAFLEREWRDHLANLRSPTGPRVPVFPTRTGGRQNASNIRNRLLAESVRRANARRAEKGAMLLPDRVTPHTLRRTFATLALTAGRDPRWVMAQIGHSDARFTLSVYAQVLQRQRIDYDLVWELMRFPDEPSRWPFRRAGRSMSTQVAPGQVELPFA